MIHATHNNPYDSDCTEFSCACFVLSTSLQRRSLTMTDDDYMHKYTSGDASSVGVASTSHGHYYRRTNGLPVSPGSGSQQMMPFSPTHGGCCSVFRLVTPAPGVSSLHLRQRSVAAATAQKPFSIVVGSMTAVAVESLCG